FWTALVWLAGAVLQKYFRPRVVAVAVVMPLLVRCLGFSGQLALRSLVERKAGALSQGRTYKPEFKQMAVEMVLDSDKSVAKVAKELDINEWTLRNWVKQARKSHR